MIKLHVFFILGIFLFPFYSSGEDLVIFWAEWDPANYLQELVDEYPGTKVTVETTPWSDFQTKTFREFAARGDSYDIVVGDSQWVGAGATQGHYVELTDWIKKNRVDKSMTEASMVGFSEYPKGKGRYWSVPLEGDALGWAYRKDWFEDPKEKAAFKKKFNYELKVPETWAQLKDIAEFFHRPSEKRYGVAIYTEKEYDALTTGIAGIIWSWGADLGDMSFYQVDGILNSRNGVEALKFYKRLYAFTPPGWGNASLSENNQAITEGLAAMSMNYFAFFPALANPASNKYASKTGFFSNPWGRNGQYTALGGQGASVISYSKKQAESMKFLEWFIREDVQERWAELGGYTCNKDILTSEKFLKSTPYNRAFMESMLMVKDFWAVPEYAELLEVSQRNWHAFLVEDKGTAKQAMDKVTKEWEGIFRKYKRLK